MSHQRAMPSQIFGQPHSQAYEQQRRETADRQEAAKTAARCSRLRELETEYRHLPPLPPRLPSPPYMVHDTPVCHADDAASAFYVACSGGNLDHVRAFVQEFQPPAADLAYALEEACQNFRLDVVRFLLQQPDTRLHHRCFRRSTAHPEDDLAEKFGAGESRSVSQSIFTSGHPRLIDLLKTFLEFGWHPNQLLGPLQKGKRPPIYLPRQEVALHYPRCILDLDILRLLLDAGADPTIARDVVADIYFDLADQPVQRMSGHILEMAVNLGTAEAVTLLLSRGARPAYGIPLHSLVRRRPDSSKIRIMDDAYTRELWHETPELQYPTLSTRLTMAGHLISHGEDINRIANVYRLVGRYCQVPTLAFEATALSHAKECMDWALVQWLLENGADPAANPRPTFPPELIYSMGASSAEVEDMYQNVINKTKVKQEKGNDTQAVQ